MTFRLEIIQVGKIPYFTEFDETSIFWYPCVAHDAWIDFYFQTVEIRPLECRENLLFVSLSPFSLSIQFSSLSLVCSPFFFSFAFLFLSFLIHLHFLLLFVPSSSLFISFNFLFSHFLFSSFFSYFLPYSFSYSYRSSEGNFPPLSSLATCHHHVFLPYFLYFLFPFYYIM